MKTNFLQSLRVVVTGGTSALGESMVRTMLDAGADVDFTFCGNETKAKELSGLGARAHPLNLLKNEEMDRFAAALKEKHPKVDVLIHNAAAIRDHTLKNLEESEWDEVLDADLKAPYYLTKKMLPMLMKKKATSDTRGKIFFVTSRVGLQGGIGVSNYAAAKAGLIGLTKSLAQELGRKRILVNAVNPGFMRSAMTRELPEEVIQKNLGANPLNDWSNPDEVAEFIAFLASEKMTQVTGQIFNYEGRKI